jgi:hypothetical protein
MLCSITKCNVARLQHAQYPRGGLAVEQLLAREGFARPATRPSLVATTLCVSNYRCDDGQ